MNYLPRCVAPSGPRGTTVVLAAFYAGVEPRWPEYFVSPGYAELRLYAVPATERRRTERAPVDAALPALAAWLHACGAGPETWRSEPHELQIALDGSQIVLFEDDLSV